MEKILKQRINQIFNMEGGGDGLLTEDTGDEDSPVFRGTPSSAEDYDEQPLTGTPSEAEDYDEQPLTGTPSSAEESDNLLLPGTPSEADTAEDESEVEKELKSVLAMGDTEKIMSFMSSRSLELAYAAVPAGAKRLTGTNSGDGITLSGVYELEDYTYTANKAHSAITVASGQTLTLYITGTVKLTGGAADGNQGGGAGIRVDKGSTLILRGNGTLYAIGGDASDGEAGERGKISSYAKGGSGGGGAGAGIGGKGGDGGAATKGEGKDGTSTSAGLLFIIGGMTVNASGGNPGSGGAGGNGIKNTGYVVVTGAIFSGGGGGGGGGAGYPAAGIGGGGSGGGSGGGGAVGAGTTTVPFRDSSAGGGGGGGAGAGYQSGGGGGGGGAAKYTNALIGGTVNNGEPGRGGGPGEDGTTPPVYKGINGGGGGKAGVGGMINKGGDGGIGGTASQSHDTYTADADPGHAGGSAGNSSSVEQIFISGNAHITSTASGCDQVGNGGSPIYSPRGDALPAYDLEDYSVSLEAADYTYDGSEKRPEVRIDSVIQPGCNIIYKDNLNAGTATVIVEGRQDVSGQTPYVIGSKTTTFQIKKADMNPAPTLNVGKTQIEYMDSVMVNVLNNIGDGKVTFEIAEGDVQLTEVTNGVATIRSNAIGRIKVKASIEATQNFNAASCEAEVMATAKSINQCYVVPIGKQEFKGSELKPPLTLTYGETPMTEGRDYTLEYKDNVNIGLATVVITGKGNYKDSREVTFLIVNASIQSAELTMPETVYTYDLTEHTPEPVLKYGGKTLVKDSDYILGYRNNRQAGTATLIITGQGDFTGSREETFDIKPVDMKKAVISSLGDVTFNGAAFQPDIIAVYKNGTESESLSEGTDYHLKYDANVMAGTAEVTVEGCGNYTGKQSVPFTILPRPIHIIPAPGQFKEKPDTGILEDPADLGTNYTVTGYISGYVPVFEGGLSRQEGEGIGSYKITAGTLKFTDDIVNKSYVWDLETEYFSIVEPKDIDATVTLVGQKNEETGWYTGAPVQVTVEDGYLISKRNSTADTNIWSQYLTFPDGDYSTGGVAYYIKDGDGNISRAKYALFKQDVVAPTGNIVIVNRAWNSFMNTITFGNFFKDTIKIRVDGSDYTSGIAGIYYHESGTALELDQVESLGEDQWTEVTTDDKSFSKEPETGTIYYAKIVDQAGNISYINTDGIIYDKEMPKLEVTYAYDDVWTDDKDAQIVIEASDEGLSGLQEKHVSYRLDNQAIVTLPIEAGKAGTTLSDLPNGNYSVWVSAEDQAGNISNVEIHVKKDVTPPVIQAAPEGGSGWQNTERVKVSVYASDPESGISKWSYSLDGGATFSAEADYEPDGDHFFEIAGDGCYDQIIIRAVNGAGKSSQTQLGEVVVRKDQAKPQVELVITDFGSNTAQGGDIWYRSSAPVLSFDIATGRDVAPADVYWKCYVQGADSDSQPWEKDGLPQISAAGQWVVEYYAESSAGLKSEVKTEVVRWDNTSPAFETPAFDYQTVSGGLLDSIGNYLSFGSFFSEGIKVTIHAGDVGSGLEEIEYRVNGGPGRQISVSTGEFLIEKGTTGSITVQLKDKAGNTAAQKLTNDNAESDIWSVEDEAPVISEVTVNANPNEAGWYRNQLELSADIMDTDSGLQTVSSVVGSNGIVEESFSKNGKVKEFRFTQQLEEEGDSLILQLEAVDNAGNTSSKQETYKVDLTNPDVSCQVLVGGEVYTEAVTTRQAELKFSLSDALSGLKKATYTLDSGKTWFTREYNGEKSAEITLPLADGNYNNINVAIKVWDMADNCLDSLENGELEIDLRQDTTPAPAPTLKITPGENGAFNETAGWYTGEKPPVISLTLEDGEVTGDTNKGYWKMWKADEPEPEEWKDINRGHSVIIGEDEADGEETGGSGEPLPELEKPVITGEGHYILQYYSEDTQKNTLYEQPAEVHIRWDATRPEYAEPAYTVHPVESGTLEQIGNYLTLGNFFREKVKITVFVDDAVSGIDKLTYRINDGREQEVAPDAASLSPDKQSYSFTLPMGTKGSIFVTASDKAGITREIQVMGAQDAGQWILEDGAPVIGTLTTSVTASAYGWYNQDVPLGSLVTDGGSGLQAVQWTVNGADGSIDFAEPGAPSYAFSQTLEGEGGNLSVVISAKDQAGNESSRESFFKLDRTKPEVSALTIAAPENYQAGAWSKETVRVTAELSDQLSGVARAAYTTDGGARWTEVSFEAEPAQTTRTLEFQLADGVYLQSENLIQVKVWDFADNTGDSVTAGLSLPDIRQDTQPAWLPELHVRPDGTYGAEYGWYAGHAPMLSFSMNEARSGSLVEWKLWNTSAGETEPVEWSRGTPEIGQADGIYRMKWRGVSGSGMVTDEQTKDISWDSTPPALQEPAFTYEVADENAGTLEKLGAFLGFGNYFNGGVRITVHMTEELSGFKSMTYSINGAETGNIPLDGTDAYRFIIPKGTAGSVTIQAEDKAGNRTAAYVLGSENGTEWYIEDTKPMIGLMSADISPSEKGWYNQDPVLTIPVSDYDSGLREVAVKLGSLEEERETLSDQESGAKKVTEYSLVRTLEEEGIIKVAVTATDNASNEFSTDFICRLDKTPPSDVTMQVVSPADYDGGFVNQDLVVSVTAKDIVPPSGSCSGVKGFDYSTDSGKSWVWMDYDPANPEKNRFTISRDGIYGAEAFQSVQLKVWDYADNCYAATDLELLQAKRDTEAPPVARLSIVPGENGTYEGNDGSGWYNGDTAPDMTLHVDAAAEGEAPNHVIWYLRKADKALTDQTVWKKDGKPVITEEGSYILTYYTCDDAGNTAGDQPIPEVAVRYDRTPPEYKLFTFQPVGDTALERLGNFLTFGNYFKEAVKVTVDLDDAQSDVQGLNYSINGSVLKPADSLGGGSFSFKIPMDTKGQITVYATDKAGNIAEEQVLGSNGNDRWLLEGKPPKVTVTPGTKPNQHGWYCADIPLSIQLEDGDSGVWKITAAFNDQVENKEYAEYMESVNYLGTLAGEGKEVPLSVQAWDNAQNMATTGQTYSIDQTKPVISDISGWPSQVTGEAVPVSFRVSDTISGVDPELIVVKQAGDGQTATSSEAEDESGDSFESAGTLTVSKVRQDDGSYLCSFTLEENGSYRIEAADMAGNEVWSDQQTVTLIDREKPENAGVTVVPENPDGSHGWYVEAPEIGITEPQQTGAAKIDTCYTLVRRATASEATPSDGEPTEEAETAPVIYEASDPSTWPRVSDDGIWDLHVWTVNELNVKSGEEIRRELKVDTHGPEGLVLDGIPEEKAVNRDVQLTARARAAVTPPDTWSYSLDGGLTWSGVRSWEEENSFTVETDIPENGQVLFKVTDYAGNTTVSQPYKLWRDTVAPVLTPVRPENQAQNVPLFTSLVFQADEAVTKSEGGSVQIYHAASGTLWCEVPVSSDSVEIADKTVTVMLPYSLEPNTNYYARVTAGTVRDTAGNDNLLTGGLSAWSFRTGESLAELSVHYEITKYGGTHETYSKTSLEAVMRNNMGTVYDVLSRADYIDEHDSAWIRLEVKPKMENGAAGAFTVTSSDPDIQIKQDSEDSFEVWMPESADKVCLTVSYTGLISHQIYISRIGDEFTARAEGLYNPEIEEDQMLNSVNLRKEAASKDIKAVELLLVVEDREADPEAQATGDSRLEQLLGIYLPRSGISTDLLNISLFQTNIGEDDTPKTKQLDKITNPIKITLDIPEELRSKQFIYMARIHDGEISFIDMAVNGDKSRGTLYSDRYSDYVLIGSDENMISTVGGGGGSGKLVYRKRILDGEITYVVLPAEESAEISTATPSAPSKEQKKQKVKTVKWQEAVCSDQPVTAAATATASESSAADDRGADEENSVWKDIRIGGGALLLAVLLLMVSMYIRHRRRQRDEEPDEET